MALRIAAAIFLWLGVVPLATAYLYHGWMHRPSSIIARLKWELVPGDLVSGLVITSFIIVTFLSFMSFADFLRFNAWQHDRGIRADNRLEEERDDELGRDEWDMTIVQLEIINRLKHNVSRAASNHQQASHAEDYGQELELMKELFEEMDMLIRPEPNEVSTTGERKEELQRHFQIRDLLKKYEILETDNAGMRREIPRVATPPPWREEDATRDTIVSILRRQELEEEDEEYMPPPIDDEVLEGLPPLEHQGQAPFPPVAGNNDRFDRFDPLQPGLNPDDDVDVDINVALDELLGLRGPFSILIRNVFWLLAFNTTYLGLFAFIPKNFGSSVYSIAFNRTAFSGWTTNVTSVSPEINGESTFGELISALNEESRRLDATMRLPDLVTITLGYLSMALLVVLLSTGVLLYKKYTQTPQPAGRHVEMNERARRPRRPVQEAHPPMGEGAIHNEAVFLDGMDDEREIDEIGSLGEQLSVALDCLKALTKVGFLLFHKMLLLPLTLGIWLDAATLSIFGDSRLDRVLYAGGDLFSSALLHWVVGITFMLFVTVSVLQLREVAHPGLLARVIRPQEPQPDLLSNLLQESLATHAKRMLVSFVIYAALLSLHVWLPARILVAFGMGQYMPFARPHFAHILMPQLQVPLELFVFHLTMLALLEKYKNRIGEMQHSWLLFLCNLMGLTEYVLPRSVEKFALVGSRPIFLEQITTDNENCIIANETTGNGLSSCVDANNIMVDPFWYELAATKPSDIEEFLSGKIGTNEEVLVYEVGTARQNGHRIPRNCKARITLPPSSSRQEIPIPLVGDADNVAFLPTSIGPFRMCTRTMRDKTVVIEFWREVAGSPIPRPPEGWDDLGVGGAELQGRWAWGKEKKSAIENGTAQRTQFFGKGKNRMSSLSFIFKGMAVFILSWFVITIAVCFAFSFPLMAGRAVFILLRVPDSYVHDPFAFAIGICLWNPTFSLLSGLFKSEHSMMRRFSDWASAFRFPPFRKLLVVSMTLFTWLVVSPLMLGTIYDLILLKGPRYFSGEHPIFEASSLAMSCATGTMLLNAWALLCYNEVFTWSFWENVGNAAFEAELERGDDRRAQGLERNPRDADNREDLPNIERWQGVNGKIGQFVHMLTSTLLHWEWDVVDHEVLLQECAFPVARQILIALATPSVLFFGWLFSLRMVQLETANVVLPVFGEVENALYRTCVFRVYAIVTLLAQLAAANQPALRSWFQVAHKAARDSRYLEGEILLNYRPL
jgi:E3 ubiquitin-protein ligase MARCH6